LTESDNYGTNNDHNKKGKMRSFMREDIYNDVQRNVEKLSGKNIPFWDKLAEKWGFSNKETIRSQYRNEAKRRGYSLYKARQKNGPRILIFDLETSPLSGYFWGLWEQNISIGAILKDWHLISYAAKWLFDEDVISEVMTPREMANENDYRLTKSMWNLLDEADIAVAYNGMSFDVKRINTCFLKHELPPTSPYISVDPIRVAKKKFDFSSNKMDYISQFLDGDRKLHTDFSLWARCMDGNSDALNEMDFYCRQDIAVLESIYLNFLPWMDGNHPNMNVFYDDEISRCPMCSSVNIEYTGKEYKTTTNSYPSFVCKDCGYQGKSRKGSLSKEKRKTIVR
jgi:hypothetical protein